LLVQVLSQVFSEVHDETGRLRPTQSISDKIDLYRVCAENFVELHVQAAANQR
jgi:hypothetical protein